VEKLMTIVQMAAHPLMAGVLLFPQTLSGLAF
jgi:hypothetical protein